MTSGDVIQVLWLAKFYFWYPWVSFSKPTELTYTFIKLGNIPLAMPEENM